MFYENKQYYQVILMATYILAQTLICFGMSNKKNKIEGEKNKNYIMGLNSLFYYYYDDILLLFRYI